MKQSTELKLPEYYLYKEFLNECKLKKYDENIVLHKHHIIPRHLWDGDNLDIDENIISLSVADHCNAHILLSRCFDDGSYEQIANLQSARILDNKSIRNVDDMKKISEAMKGSGNHFYGKSHTTETKSILSEKAREHNKKFPTYEDKYGKRANIERNKRKQGVKSSWLNMTNEERKVRSNNISKSLKGKMKGSDNGFAQPILVDGVYFGSVSEAIQELNVNRYYLFKNYTIIKTKKKI